MKESLFGSFSSFSTLFLKKYSSKASYEVYPGVRGWFFFFCIVVLVFGTVFAAVAPKRLLSLDKIMTKEEQQQTGLSKLSPKERAALEEWLTRFAINFAMEMTKKSSVYPGVGQKHWVREKIDNGALIKLEDGSLWQISPFDRINTMLWLPIDDVIVIESKNPHYPYMLIGERDTAEAKLLSK